MMRTIINIKKQLRFDDWWKNVGSALRPLECEDMENHAYRVSKIAWSTAINNFNDIQKTIRRNHDRKRNSKKKC